MVSRIYKITNDINNRVYIGKTTSTLEKRFKEHCYDSRKRNNEKRPLYSAIKKYGIEHFKISLIEECPIDKENEREISWIAYYKGYENGYNATLGGEGTCIYSREEIVSLLNQGKTTKEICNKLKCSKDVVYNVANSFNIPLNIKENKLCQKMKSSRQKVYQLDKKTNEILQEFDSYTLAAKWLIENKYAKGAENGIRSHISEVCKGKRKSAYQFKWQDKKEIQCDE